MSSKASTSVQNQKGDEDEHDMLKGDQQLQLEVQTYLHHLQELCFPHSSWKGGNPNGGLYDMLGETLKSIDDEVQRLEGALRGLAMLEPIVEEQETLVTKMLTLNEVRQELAEWKDPIKAEYDSLLSLLPRRCAIFQQSEVRLGLITCLRSSENTCFYLG